MYVNVFQRSILITCTFCAPFCTYRFYAVIVVRSPPVGANSSSYADAGPYDDETKPQYYITAAWSSLEDVPSSFAIGDEIITAVGGVVYENVPLNCGTDYAFFVRIDIQPDEGQDDVSQSINQSILTTFIFV